MIIKTAAARGCAGNDTRTPLRPVRRILDQCTRICVCIGQWVVPDPPGSLRLHPFVVLGTIKMGTDGHGGTSIGFTGVAETIDLKAAASLQSSLIHWA
jgi:hypothetical protein